jgi:hypothetical protein
MNKEQIVEFIRRAVTSKDGKILYGFHEQTDDELYERYKYFLEFLKEEYSDFTTHELLKSLQNLNRLKKVYNIFGAQYYLEILDKVNQ